MKTMAVVVYWWRAGLAGLAACHAAVSGLAGMELGTNFWNLRWHAADDCFQEVKAVRGDNPWNPVFLEELQPFRSLRFMDWDGTNGSTRRTWGERPRKDAPDQSTAAYEWMVDLCNRVGADLWVCVPHPAIDRNQGDQPSDYALRLALLIKTGVDMGAVDLTPMLGGLEGMSAADLESAGGKRTGAALREDLRVYFEYSNETWNGSFQQSHYAAVEGHALGLNPQPKVNEKGEDWTAGFRFHAWAALRIFRAAELVFGKDSPRVVKVLATHVANSHVSRQHLAVLAEARWNPWGLRADAIAAAPYFGRKVDGNAADRVEQLREAMQEPARNSARLKAMAEEAGLRLIAYEGGQHVVKGAEAASRDPAMYDLYREYLAEMSRHYDHFSHYCHVGGAKDRGAWGSLERTGQPLAEAHKYRALVDLAGGGRD